MRLHKQDQYISYFPNNYLEKTPLVTPQEPKQFDKTLEQIIPENQNAPFNMKDLINRVIDEGSFYEVKKFAQELITGLARIDGALSTLLTKSAAYEGRRIIP